VTQVQFVCAGRSKGQKCLTMPDWDAFSRDPWCGQMKHLFKNSFDVQSVFVPPASAETVRAVLQEGTEKPWYYSAITQRFYNKSVLLDSLPDENIIQIVDRLGLAEVHRLRLTSKYFYRCLRSTITKFKAMRCGSEASLEHIERLRALGSFNVTRLFGSETSLEHIERLRALGWYFK
jgi:hypothetical protein